MSVQQILSPIDGAVYASFETLSDASADALEQTAASVCKQPKCYLKRLPS